MKVLITGAGGQVGRVLLATAPAEYEIIGLDRAGLDIGDAFAVTQVMQQNSPTLVINAAAYTAVDRAESELAEATRINTHAPGYLVHAAAGVGARLIHISTDFVFDGATTRPYRPDDLTAPLSAYGLTKRNGELAVLASDSETLVVRTAWVYAAGNPNFMTTMLRLMAEQETISVVSDQIGTPTHAASLAAAIWKLAATDARGIAHWTDAGVASWYDFAVAIREEAIAAGLPIRANAVIPITTADYPTPARRPSYALLDKSETWAITGLARHWRAELRAAIATIHS